MLAPSWIWCKWDHGSWNKWFVFGADTNFKIWHIFWFVAYSTFFGFCSLARYTFLNGITILNNWKSISLVFSFTFSVSTFSNIRICCFCSVLYVCEFYIFGFQTVGQARQAISDNFFPSPFFKHVSQTKRLIDEENNC